MMIEIENPEVGEIITRLSQLTGKSPAQVVMDAVREHPEASLHPTAAERDAYKARVLSAVSRFPKVVVGPTSTPEEIIGYNAFGYVD